MWALDNQTPFAAERTWVRDLQGAEVWVVAVKGTFAILPDGSTELAKKQEEVCRAPVFRGDPGQSSLLYEADLIHTKPATDILLHGQAYAPHREPARQVDVTMKVGELTKTLRVVGERRWEKGMVGPALSPPEPFTTMPIVYERAFGGMDRTSDDPRQHGWEARNPVGVGFATAAAHVIGRRGPNVEAPEEAITRWQQRPLPAGFGPIARDWSPRVELAGTYDECWFNQRRPLLPTDFDNRFYQAAPADQQSSGFLRGGEPVELVNLTPGGVLRFRLPRVAIGFTTRVANKCQHHTARLHTVILEPDHPRVILVWHTALECHHDVYTLKATRVYQKKDLSLPPSPLAEAEPLTV